MYLFEPARTQFDLNFSLFGIHVRVHPMFWVVTAILGSNQGEARYVLLWVAVAFVSILIHEMGHVLGVHDQSTQAGNVMYISLGVATRRLPTLPRHRPRHARRSSQRPRDPPTTRSRRRSPPPSPTGSLPRRRPPAQARPLRDPGRHDPRRRGS